MLAQNKPLNVGDAIWLYNPQGKEGLSPKLSQPWQGPYTVTKKINDIVYNIQLTANTKPKVIHQNRLWIYSGFNAPSWFKLPSSPDIEKANESELHPADTGNMLLNESTEKGPRRSKRLQKKRCLRRGECSACVHTP